MANHTNQSPERWVYIIAKETDGELYYVVYDDDIYENRLIDFELTAPDMDIVTGLERRNMKVISNEVVDEFWDEDDPGIMRISFATVIPQDTSYLKVSGQELKDIIVKSSVLSAIVKQRILKIIGTERSQPHKI